MGNARTHTPMSTHAYACTCAHTRTCSMCTHLQEMGTLLGEVMENLMGKALRKPAASKGAKWADFIA